MTGSTSRRWRLPSCALVLVWIAACDAEPGPRVDQVEPKDTRPGTTTTVAATPAPPASPASPPASPPPTRDTAVPPEPSPAVSPVAAAAESVRQWASANSHGGNLPKLFRPTSPLTLAIEVDACDGEPSECISRLDLPNAAAFEVWLTDNVGELPGMDVSTKIESCNDDNCCTFANLGREAAKEGGMVPHELFELRSVCFDVDQQTVLGVRRMKFVNW